jgi:hypothetical protein
MKMDGPKAPTIIPGSFGITYCLSQKANMTDYCLENQFTSHDLCEENHKQRVETRVQGLLVSVDESPMEKLRPCDIQKLVHTEIEKGLCT